MIATLLGLAGLMGVFGVIVSAAAAHGAPESGLGNAGAMLLFHAAALVGGTAALHAGLFWRPLGLAALCGFALGAALFAGDIAARAYLGHRLFPMAAPTGGSILIAGWLALALAALVPAR